MDARRWTARAKGAEQTDAYFAHFESAVRPHLESTEGKRAVLVLKLRSDAHPHAMHEAEITDSGMRLLGPIRGIPGILAGLVEVIAEAAGAEGGHAGRRA